MGRDRRRYGTWFSEEFSREANRLEATALPPSTALVKESGSCRIARAGAALILLSHAGVVGQPIPLPMTLPHKGRLRASTADNWVPFEADETHSGNPPAVAGRASFPVPMAQVVPGGDEHRKGLGCIEKKMPGFLPIADEFGPRLGPNGLGRILDEMMWFPAGVRGLTVAPDGDNPFSAILTDRCTSAVVTFFVDA